MRWFRKICDKVHPTIVGALVLLLGPVVRDRANGATLLIELGGERREDSAAELLANVSTKTIEIPQDTSYGRSMRYTTRRHVIFNLSRLPNASDPPTSRCNAPFRVGGPMPVRASALAGCIVEPVSVNDKLVSARLQDAKTEIGKSRTETGRRNSRFSARE